MPWWLFFGKLGWFLVICFPCLCVTLFIDACLEGCSSDDPRKRAITSRSGALTAVRCDGLALERASKELRSDREVVLAAVNNNGLALQFADTPFTNNGLKADTEIVLAAVQNNGAALQHASPARREERHICMTAVKNVRKLLITPQPSDT